MILDDKLIDKFWKHIEKSADDNGCWLWSGSASNEYGVVQNRGRSVQAHRLSWMLHNNAEIPRGMCICHRCDVPICVNPKHLFLGTHKDNSADFVQKGWRDIRLRLTAVFRELPEAESRAYRGLIHWSLMHPEQVVAAKAYLLERERLLLTRSTEPVVVDGVRHYGVWERNRSGVPEDLGRCIGTVLNFGAGEPTYRQCKRPKTHGDYCKQHHRRSNLPPQQPSTKVPSKRLHILKSARLRESA